jgi:predicted esterase
VKSFNELYDKVQALRLTDNHADALAMLRENIDTFPDELHRILYTQAVINASLGQDDEAVCILQTAFEQGYWYNPEFYFNEPVELKHLFDRADFRDLIALSHQRMDEAQQHSTPQLEVMHPASGPSRQVFIALHGNNSNGARTKPNWTSLVDIGWTLALPTSSQVMNYRVFRWNDIATTERELTDHFTQLSGEIFVVGGFSRGAHAGIRAALIGLLPVHGFVAIAPVLHDLDDMLGLLNTRPDHLRGFIVVGEHDPYGIKKPQTFAEAFGPDCYIEVRANLGHEFPPDMDATLQRALAFIVG